MCSSDWRLWKHTKWSQDEKDVRNDISVYEEGADLEGTLTYGTLFIEPQTQHMIDLFMKEHPGVKIETKVVFDNDVTDEQYNEGLNTLLTELASDQRADIYDATYLPSEIKTKGSGYFEDLNQYIDADPNFNRDDYYDNILRAAEVDGKLYQIPEGFYCVMLRLNRNITDELNYESRTKWISMIYMSYISRPSQLQMMILRLMYKTIFTCFCR